jgi:hypothetical protein
MKPRVQDVLEKQEDLRPDEFDLYSSGHFDFVVYGTTDDMPAFALEFDGPSHGEPRQVERDVVKNRLCAAAQLPLLRLGVGALIEIEQVTILEWLLRRFVRWQCLLSETTGPEFSNRWFNYLENPFPPNLALAHRLFDQYGIGTRTRAFEILRSLEAFKPFWRGNILLDRSGQCDCVDTRGLSTTQLLRVGMFEALLARAVSPQQNSASHARSRNPVIESRACSRACRRSASYRC